jgi:hypothetical protein
MLFSARLKPTYLPNSMPLPTVFVFAPLPLTKETSPLAQVAVLSSRLQAEMPVGGRPRHRISPLPEKKPSEMLLN